MTHGQAEKPAGTAVQAATPTPTPTPADKGDLRVVAGSASGATNL